MKDNPLERRAEEQVFDYFLHELISGQSAPDLSQRIAAAWSREQAGLADPATRTGAIHTGPAARAAQSATAQPFSVSPLNSVTRIAQPVIALPICAPAAAVNSKATAPPSIQAQPATCAAQPIIARPVYSGSAAPGAIDEAGLSQGVSLRRHIVAALLATGACGLLAVLSWQMLDPDRALPRRLLELARAEVRNLTTPPLVGPSPVAPSPTVADQPAANTTPRSLAASPPTAVDRADPTATPQALVADAAQKPATSAESTALFPLDRRSVVSESRQAGSIPADALQANSGESTAGTVALPLDGQQIVAQIDQRVAGVWRELSVTPSPKFDDAQRALQVSLVLTGQPPTGAAGELDALVSEATASLPFARRWADQFVSTWLAGSSLAADDARVQTLKKHFAEYIYEGRPWNATALELLGGPLALAPLAAAERSNPTAEADPITSAFVSALAGDGNHRLVSHIGTNFLDIDLSCARCHDVDSPSLAAQWSGSAPSAKHEAGRQAMYWSLAAMLRGIETRVGQGGKRIVVDRQPELLAAGKSLTAYYDLIDGRLQAAEPRLPGGQAWETIAGADAPRQALAEWISRSPAMDEATVNQVWRMIFGQPLVSRTPVQFNLPAANMPAADQSSTQLAERQQRELLELLSTQYRAHGHDLKQLIGWIVRSDAFRRQPLRLTHAQWLAASQDELRQWQVARASFANGAMPIGATDSRSLEASLAMVLQWRERSGGGADTALAQPVPNLTPAPAASSPSKDSKGTDSKAARSKDSGGAGELNERMRLAPPSATELAFVDRLLANQRLSWKDCIEHIVCLAPELLPDSRIQILTDELLRQHKGDARAALLDLLWAVQQ